MQTHNRRYKHYLLALVLVAGGAWLVWHNQLPTAKTASASPTVAHHTTTSKTKPTAVNRCASNSQDKAIIVSISQRHLWACQQTNSQFDSAVVTGDMNQAENLTPTGTYHIYAKATDQVLTGSDGKGSWRDPVSYWMPFLDNQYGTYGLHDATWRKPGDFGTIDPYSSQASHGCVELPLATAKWLYEWSPVGTVVQITS